MHAARHSRRRGSAAAVECTWLPEYYSTFAYDSSVRTAASKMRQSRRRSITSNQFCFAG
uniref:Uncharacterized protein n=1 Tax=Arundo donax TaxID=35708 RepID=A0A0A8ZN52_ARUDO